MSSSSENVVLSSSDSVPVESAQPQVKLIDVVVTDENVALNVMVSFLSLAQRRGAFGIDEAAKIWECVQKFQKV
jgi:hypothetical protein